MVKSPFFVAWVFNLPTERLIPLIEDFLQTHQLRITSTYTTEKGYAIISDSTSGFLKMLFFKHPSRVKWWLTADAPGVTRVDIEFSLTPLHRIATWAIILPFMLVSLLIIYHVGDVSSLKVGIFCIMSSVHPMAVTLCFLRALSEKAYENLATSFKTHVIGSSVYQNSGYETLQSTVILTSIDNIMLILAFLAYGALLIIISSNKVNSTTIPFPVFHLVFSIYCGLFLFCLLFLLVLFLVGGVKYFGLSHRFGFMVAGLCLSFSFFCFASTPLLVYPMLDTTFSREGIRRNEKSILEAYGRKNDPVHMSFVNKLRKFLPVLVIYPLIGFCAGFLFLWFAYKAAFGWEHGKKELLGNVSFRSDIYWGLSKDILSGFFPAVLFLYWLVSNAGVVWGIWVSFGLLELSLLEGLGVFENEIAEQSLGIWAGFVYYLFYPKVSAESAILLAKAFCLCLTAPPAAIIFFFVYTRFSLYLRNIFSFFHRQKNTPLLARVNSAVTKGAEVAGISPPKPVLIANSFLYVESLHIDFPFFRKAIRFTEGCSKLTDGQLYGLIAHELYHLKAHARKWRFLHFLSDFSLLGTGWFACMMASYKMEFDADKAACGALLDEGYSLEDYEQALEMMDISRRAERHLSFSGGMLCCGSDNDKPVRMSRRRNVVFRIWDNLVALAKLRYGDVTVSYIHPPVSMRIEKVRETYGNA